MLHRFIFVNLSTGPALPLKDTSQGESMGQGRKATRVIRTRGLRGEEIEENREDFLLAYSPGGR
jgi:hypothetical protein